MLSFDEATHTYQWNGRRVINTTRVLDFFCRTYDRVPPEILERARQEGQAIHRSIELYLADRLGHLPAWLEPFIMAFERFRFDTGFELEHSELRMYNPRHDYTGTLDLTGYMNFRALGRRHVLLDIKRSFAGGAAIGLQLASYSHALVANGGEPIHYRAAIRFVPESTPPYRLQEFNDPADFDAFRGMLTTYQWLEKNGRLDA